MHGLIGKMIAVEGQRDALLAILLEGIHDMPGCLGGFGDYHVTEPVAGVGLPASVPSPSPRRD